MYCRLTWTSWGSPHVFYETWSITGERKNKVMKILHQWKMWYFYPGGYYYFCTCSRYIDNYTGHLYFAPCKKYPPTHLIWPIHSQILFTQMKVVYATYCVHLTCFFSPIKIHLVLTRQCRAARQARQGNLSQEQRKEPELRLNQKRCRTSEHRPGVKLISPGCAARASFVNTINTCT